MNGKTPTSSEPDIKIEGAFTAVSRFLRELGLQVHIKAGVNGFLQDVAIEHGCLLVAREDGDLAGELLHEAGHLAILPDRFRGQACGDLSEVTQAMGDWLDRHERALDPDDIQIRSILQSGEAEAVAWSYAAATMLDIDTRIPFYRGFDEAGLELHDQVASGHYFGVYGLAAAGMTELPRRWATTPFPVMKRWLQV